MKKNNSKIKKLFGCLLVGIIVLIIIIILNGNVSKNNDKKEPENMTLSFNNRVEQLKSFDAGEFYKVGWLQIQGTHIDLPILNSASGNNEDDITYSYGWISPGYVTGENRPVIMAHNILNVSNTPMLPDANMQNFEELMAFVYYGFAKDNLYIQYTIDDREEIYLIYAVGFYDYGYDSAQSFHSKDKVKKYISEVKKNSIYDYDIDVNENDEILTIKTCTRYFGANEKQQFFVDARKLRKNEKIIKYNVKTTENFKKLNLKQEKL